MMVYAELGIRTSFEMVRCISRYLEMVGAQNCPSVNDCLDSAPVPTKLDTVNIVESTLVLPFSRMNWKWEVTTTIDPSLVSRFVSFLVNRKADAFRTLPHHSTPRPQSAYLNPGQDCLKVGPAHIVGDFTRCPRGYVLNVPQKKQSEMAIFGCVEAFTILTLDDICSERRASVLLRRRTRRQESLGHRPQRACYFLVPRAHCHDRIS